MPSQLFRLNAFGRPLADLSPTLSPYSKSSEGTFMIPDLQALKEYRIVVSTCITASVLHAVGIPAGGHYGHIFIDEAGQALVPEVMVPLKTLGGPQTNVVLAGDPKQLGPIVRSRHAIKLGLRRSYLEHLIANPIYDISRGNCTTSVLYYSPFPFPPL
jgi:helicase MOV-10